ncbi:hypothetical protein K435DRAFT_696855, partial [Dendrothele bispora CBS 962.96]
MFCTWCKCTQDDKGDVDYEKWKLRNANEVIQEANAWRSLTTQAARKDQEKRTGVRWSPLYDLPYWDPVKHLILGYMHNTLEGILQYHLRDLWHI